MVGVARDGFSNIISRLVGDVSDVDGPKYRSEFELRSNMHFPLLDYFSLLCFDQDKVFSQIIQTENQDEN